MSKGPQFHHDADGTRPASSEESPELMETEIASLIEDFNGIATDMSRYFEFRLNREHLLKDFLALSTSN